MNDLDAQDILVLNLSRPVQLCVDIGSHIIGETEQPSPQAMGGVFTALENLSIISPANCKQIKGAVGFRNIAVHNYESINWEIVYAICEKAIVDFHRFALEITEFSILSA